MALSTGKADEFTPKSRTVWLMDKNGSMINVQETIACTESKPNDLDLLSNSHKNSVVTPASPDKRATQRSGSGKFATKRFKSRPSIMTELLDISHFRAIHHKLIAFFLLFVIRMIITEVRQPGTYDVVIQGFKFAFYRNLHITLGIFFGMHFVTILCVYPTFSTWSTYRLTLQTDSSKVRLDHFTICGFVTYMVGFVFIPACIMWNNPLAPASGFAVAMEQVRLVMKVYAFVRSNAPRVLRFEKPTLNCEQTSESKDHVMQMHHQSSDSLQHNVLMENGSPETAQTSPCPEYSKYLYFLFAPTLIYMDSYPRSDRILWTNVLWNIGQILACLWCTNYLFVQSYITHFSKIGQPDYPMSIGKFIQSISEFIPVGFTLLMLISFILLHSWQNAFAEFLRFGDRQFYKDWWNSGSVPSFMRTWNSIVHDWLYTYVMKDAVELGLGRIHSAIPTILVFILSSVTHEYIIFFCVNLFFPVNFILFGCICPVLVFNIKYRENSFWNMMFLAGMMSGSTIVFTSYGYEMSARWNCPLSADETRLMAWILLISFLTKV